MVPGVKYVESRSWSSVVYADRNSSRTNTDKFAFARLTVLNWISRYELEAFSNSWKNYETAARLKDPRNPTINKKLRTATLLNCIGSDALDVYDAFVFETQEQGKDIDVILQKFEQYCIGETNETYERYRFNKRDQNEHETIDAYVTSLRTLAKTCNFGQLENDLIRDRVVMGIRDNTTRKKLLQVAKLGLSQCIDLCRSYEKNLSAIRVYEKQWSASV